MAGSTIKVAFDDKPVIDALNRLLAAGRSMRPLLKVVGEHLVASVEKRFDTETAPDGQHWKEVTQATRKRKKHPKILTESHRLRGSIIYRVSSPDTLELGTNVVYGAIHQFGGRIERAAFSSWRKLRVDTRGNLAVFAKAKHKRARQVRFTVDAFGIQIPARPYLGISVSDRRTILEDVNDYLAEVLEGGKP